MKTNTHFLSYLALIQLRMRKISDIAVEQIKHTLYVQQRFPKDRANWSRERTKYYVIPASPILLNVEFGCTLSVLV
jgi:hypothetical protein